MAAIPGLAAAVSNAGALGMVTLTWSADVAAVVRETAALTARPFGGNFVLTDDHHRHLDQALEACLRIVSFIWGDPGEYVEAVHDAGGLVLLTVGSAEEARRAVASGVDVVVAPGDFGSQPWKFARPPASQASRSPGVLRPQPGRIWLVAARRSRHRSSNDGRPQNQ